jgi:response regulator RpfG family c-di-GMP phosphodiesterase
MAEMVPVAFWGWVIPEIKKISDVPILMLTAMGDVDDRISGLEAGVDDYLTKPFEPKELLLRISGILKRTRKKGKVGFGDIVFNFDLHTDTHTYQNGANSLVEIKPELGYLQINYTIIIYKINLLPSIRLLYRNLWLYGYTRYTSTTL